MRPLLTVATYLDDQTGFEIYQEVTGKSFNPLAEAPDEVKRMNGGKSELFMQVRGSKFVKYQECKVQEAPDEVREGGCGGAGMSSSGISFVVGLLGRRPSYVRRRCASSLSSPCRPPCCPPAVQVPQGSTPRTLVVHLRGGLTRSLKAGDSVTLSGVFLPEPYTGQRALMRATLLTATYMEVMSVRQNKQSYQEMSLSEEQRARIEAMTEEGDIYSRLASSIAPGGWGRGWGGGGEGRRESEG